MKAVLPLLLVLLGVLFACLSLAAFASVNPNVSDVLRILSVAEGGVAGTLALSALDAFWRGLLYLVLCVGSVWLATYLKPRA